MKLFYLLLFTFFIGAPAFAQNHWKVVVNDRTVLSTASEEEVKNVVVITAAELRKRNDLTIVYNERRKAGRERFMALYDDKDSVVMQQKGGLFKLSNAALASLFKQSKKLKLYTWALPTDPKRKAAIRVRRVHLCTLIAE